MAILKKEYLEILPEFSGETYLLPRFLEICEKLVNKFYNTADPDDFQNDFLMYGILSKLKGPASEVVSTSHVATWKDLKKVLLSSYSDRRDGYTLAIEMSGIKQYFNESPFDFYNRLQKLLNLQISFWKNNCVSPTEVDVICEYTRKLALRVFLKGLREPIGILMRIKDPKDLNTALNMLTNDFQFQIDQHKQQRPQFNLFTDKPLRTFRQTKSTLSSNFNLRNINYTHTTPKRKTYVKPSTSNLKTKTSYLPKTLSVSTNNMMGNTNNFSRNYQSYDIEDAPTAINHINYNKPNLKTKNYSEVQHNLQNYLNEPTDLMSLYNNKESINCDQRKQLQPVTPSKRNKKLKYKTSNIKLKQDPINKKNRVTINHVHKHMPVIPEGIVSVPANMVYSATQHTTDQPQPLTNLQQFPLQYFDETEPNQQFSNNNKVGFNLFENRINRIRNWKRKKKKRGKLELGRKDLSD